MKVVSVAVGVALLVTGLCTLSPAQVPPVQQPPPTQPPAQKPATPAAQTPAPPPKPFPLGAKIAVVRVQTVANESAEGKASTAKVQSLNQKKVAELNEKNKAVQALQQKLVAGGLMADTARTQLQREIDRLNLEIQRFTQDAQAEVEELQEQLQMDFQRKLMPIIELVAVDRGVQIIFAAETGIVWAETAIDLTAEVIRRFDGAMGAGPPKAPTAE
jgi:Skp family chaperone for outer membrane proteins